MIDLAVPVGLFAIFQVFQEDREDLTIRFHYFDRIIFNRIDVKIVVLPLNLEDNSFICSANVKKINILFKLIV